MKPAYNIQFGVDSEYIIWVNSGHQPTDTTTLIPFLKSIEDYTKSKYPKIVADSGYESEENYIFLECNNQLSFIKPANYKISKTRKYKNNIGHIDNMDYDEKNDYYICKNNKKLIANKIINSKSKTGYKSKITCYTCEECCDCQYKSSCIKRSNGNISLENRTKNLQIPKLFHEKRKENLKRIMSPEGCELRVNRSIQAEGAFAQVKQNMKFRRFLSRGKENVLSECIIVAIAHNISRLHNLHNKIIKNKHGVYLHRLKKVF